MPFIDSLTLAGLSRADGVTARTLTMSRVGDIPGGFVLRESGVTPSFATEIRVVRKRTKNGRVGQSQTQIVANFPYAALIADTVPLGYCRWDQNGLKIPDDCPQFARNDIRTQIANLISGSTVGSIAKALVYDPLVSGIFPF